MINYLEVFIYSDQPIICPKCSVRTKLIMDLSHTNMQTQIHKCFDKNCSFEFIIQSDEDFDNVSML